jgi:pyruvate-formate lyase-activating enzyme
MKFAIEKVFNSDLPGLAREISNSEQKEREKALAVTRKRLGRWNQPNQFFGSRNSIGCVSVEISQRCNLNCSLCYLSENSNRVTDLPLAQVFERLEGVRKNFGFGTNVQISGGDPTMRNRSELVQIVRYARTLGLHPALLTNGILCSRDLLMELCENGLSDVAFHVDLTQKRKGYQTEKELNAIRLEYIERARGLPLMVIFNTTVFTDNYHELPDLVRFFTDQSDRVSWASFQLQADTGRGEVRGRPDHISMESVQKQISRGAGSELPWDVILAGHPQCQSYLPALAVNGKAFGLMQDSNLFASFLREFGDVMHDRRQKASTIAWSYFKVMVRKPRWFLKALRYLLIRLWSIRRPVWAAKGKVRLITFFVKNFMHADNLDPERIDACTFMVMTPSGPVSMCAHNAKRDEYNLPHLNTETGGRKETSHQISSSETYMKGSAS